MSDIAIKVENLSKQYRLGELGTGTISHDINRWWHRIRGKQDPYLKIGEANDRASKGESEYVWALKDIDFEVKKGEVLGVIGKNGAGKSTLLKVLSKVTGPTTGSIKAKGRIASLLEVGTGFHPEMTGRENIYMNGTIMGMTRYEINKKLDEIVAFAGVERYLDTPVKRYSSGMKVRLGFAIAAHLEPEILIVDEVLAVGDAEFQKKAIGKMQDVSKGEGRTVLFVSHNMASIQALCTRTLIMENGTTTFSGDTAKGVQYYLSSNLALQDNIPLKDRTDRKGGSVLRFTNFILEDMYGKPLSSICSGMKVGLRLFFETAVELDDIRFRLQILDSYGKVLSVLNSYHSSGEVFNKVRTGSVLCIIDKVPLFSGKYSINLRAIERNMVIDDIENVVSLIVEEGDFFLTGRVPKLKEGILIDNTWSR